jgi:hypothetical protein
MKKITRDKIKALVEYNFRKYRVKGFEYQNNMPGENPSGTDNLKPPSDLFYWKQDPMQIPKDKNTMLYGLVDGNINLRDSIANTIFDILTGNDSTETFTTANTSTYFPDGTNPGGGDRENVNTNDRNIWLECDGTITLKAGGKTFVVGGADTEQRVTITQSEWIPLIPLTPPYLYTISLPVGMTFDPDKTILTFVKKTTLLTIDTYQNITDISWTYLPLGAGILLSTSTPAENTLVTVTYK